MWEISPALVRYGVTEPTSVDVALMGLKALAARTAGAKVSGAAFCKPISNFYQTDPISRALSPVLILVIFLRADSWNLLFFCWHLFANRSVTMAQCTKAFVNREEYHVPSSGTAEEAFGAA
jgi:NADH dehydrogenase (ubiquinone) Fe-S protein 1